ncbi:MAG TPA: MTH938/NDUFAF3 family protein, partial [Candidatus Edwardsbacteria bacterium]|nr:MTH938/NDUFAF3 family protein [Candidatus Edwardsbacteria bacterium]
MIDSYSFGNITIDGQAYAADVIIYPDRVDDTWWRAQGHVCALADLPDVWRHRPAALVIGTGDPGLMRVDDGLKAYCADNGIQLVV